MHFLKQSTASQVVRIGPFLDDTDFKTAETALSIANTDIKLIKGNAATSNSNKNSGGATHIANGYYYLTLDATDTSAIGRLDLFVQMSGALPVWAEYEVLPANIFDSMIGGTDLFDVSVTQFGGTNGTFASGRPEVNTSHIAGAAVSTASAQIGVNVVNAAGTAWNSGAIAAATLASDAITAAKIASAALTAAKFGADCLANSNFADGVFGPEHFTSTMLARMGVVSSGTAQSASTTGCVLASAESFGDDTLKGRTIMIFGSTQGYWQAAAIAGNVGSTDTVTFDVALNVAPSGTITYIIFGTPEVTGVGGSAPTASEIADAVWDEATSGHTTSGTFGEQVKTDIDAILVDTGTTLDGRIPAALVSGRMDVSVGAMASGVLTATAIAADAITAAKLAADVTTELQSGLATASALSTVSGKIDTIDDFLDTEIAAILADTNELQTDWANGGRLDLLLDAILADTGELQTDWVNGGRLDSLIDTIIARIPTALVAGRMAVDVQAINGVVMAGTGTEGDEFVPA